MGSSTRPDYLARAIYAIVILIGLLLLMGSYMLPAGFFKDLLLNVGSDLVVVTVVFIIFRAFRGREDSQLTDIQESTSESASDKMAEDMEHVPPDLRGVLAQRSAASGVGLPGRDYEEVDSGK